MKKTLFFISALILMILSSIAQETKQNYYAIFSFESNDVTNNFTKYQSGLKVTYDFWGETASIILENISDSTLYVNLNASLITTGNKKLNFNDMIKGSFNTLPILPDSVIELYNFNIINDDNIELVENSINEIKTFVNKQKFYKQSEYPIKIFNHIEFSVNSIKNQPIKIQNDFYASKINLISETEYYQLTQYNKQLYNKTYYFINNNENTSGNAKITKEDLGEFAKILAETLVELIFIISLGF
jgi:hypothetical protein